MTTSITESIARAWQRVRKQTGTAIAEREVAWIRGKIAGKAVSDEAGALIVDAGHPIDEAVIERAKATGKLSALVSVAMTAQAQDLKAKLGHYYDNTPEGQEARALQSADAYREARNYLGRVLDIDITDIRGNIIVPAGKQIEEQDVRACREAGQLGALIQAAESAPPAPVSPTYTPASGMQANGLYTPPPPRAPTFLVPQDEEESHEA